MQIVESVKLSVANIIQQKLRSSLTLLGVVIGVMTIIATMAVIRGLQNMMEKEMSILSAGVYQVQKTDRDFNGNGNWRQRRSRPDIGQLEVRAIEEHVDAAMIVAPEVWQYRITLKHKDRATTPSMVVAGGVPGFAPNNGYMVERGRFLSEQDVHFGRRVVVIGNSIAGDLFPFRDPVGEYVTINGQRAQVIGVLEKRGSMFNDNADYQSVIPITTFENWWGTERSWNITVQVADPVLMDEAIGQTTAVLRSIRGVKPGQENNFDIFFSNELVDSFNSMTLWIRIAALGIASIALLVAGVGIMNIMLVSVTERTREIGVRKALGAKRRSILSQFLVEAVILTWMGALIGTVVGVGGALLVGNAANLPVAIPAWSIGLGIAFCTIIGLVFGTWPAVKASRLEPITALRHE